MIGEFYVTRTPAWGDTYGKVRDFASSILCILEGAVIEVDPANSHYPLVGYFAEGPGGSAFYLFFSRTKGFLHQI
jgi:hypothetical protein